MKRTRKAFTLVELLVVIGIIAVLVSMLLPSLNKAREGARRVACASNQHQLILAMAMYLNDNKGVFPRMGRNLGQMSGSWGGASGIDNYAGEDMVSLVNNYIKRVGPRSNYATTNIIVKGVDTGVVGAVYNYPTMVPIRQEFSFPVLLCPGTNIQSNNAMGYAYYPGSADNYPMKTSHLIAAARSSGWAGTNPAVFSDQVFYAANLMPYNNHINGNSGRPAGGNVACVDGSVQWFGYKTPYVAKVFTENFVPSNGLGNNSRAFPSNACYMQVDGNGCMPAVLTATQGVYLGTFWRSGPNVPNPF